MNGQVMPGECWCNQPQMIIRVKEQREREERGGIHRRVASARGTKAHSRVISHIARFTPVSTTLTSGWWPISGTDVYIYVMPHGNHLPLSPPPMSAEPAYTRVAFRVGVRGYRTGSSSLRGEPPSWWRVAASFPHHLDPVPPPSPPSPRESRGRIHEEGANWPAPI